MTMHHMTIHHHDYDHDYIFMTIYDMTMMITFRAFYAGLMCWLPKFNNDPKNGN